MAHMWEEKNHLPTRLMKKCHNIYLPLWSCLWAFFSQFQVMHYVSKWLVNIFPDTLW